MTPTPTEEEAMPKQHPFDSRGDDGEPGGSICAECGEGESAHRPTPTEEDLRLVREWRARLAKEHGVLHAAAPSDEEMAAFRAEARREVEHGPVRMPCVCPGCPADVPQCWASGLCRPCAAEDCEHEEGTQRELGIVRDARQSEREACERIVEEYISHNPTTSHNDAIRNIACGEILRRLRERAKGASPDEPLLEKHACPACGKQTRDTTAGCDHCDLEDK